MPKGMKASSFERMKANAVKFGGAAKKALTKTAEARKEAVDKIAAFEKALKAALKEAKALSKNSIAPVSRDAAKKVATKKVASKKAGVKKAAVKKAASKKTGAKKVAGL
jgi:hypothetical protein